MTKKEQLSQVLIKIQKASIGYASQKLIDELCNERDALLRDIAKGEN